MNQFQIFENGLNNEKALAIICVNSLYHKLENNIIEDWVSMFSISILFNDSKRLLVSIYIKPGELRRKKSKKVICKDLNKLIIMFLIWLVGDYNDNLCIVFQGILQKHMTLTLPKTPTFYNTRDFTFPIDSAYFNKSTGNISLKWLNNLDAGIHD
ncbi:hypothetical protein GJ496_011360 [Pomphorhynchus laevis]|nr:hypothetical protein GJ496_011360 [Pomphorhynchus laevis]